jgi:chorismate-pyruvate lyase
LCCGHCEFNAGKDDLFIFMEEKWISQKQFYEEYRTRVLKLSPLLPPLPSPFLRLLLLSDGTVTHFLESLFLKGVAFELEKQSEIVLSDRDTKRLSIPKGSKGIERKGWLTLEPLLPSTIGKSRSPSKKRLLYVVSLFSADKLSPRLQQEIWLGQKPIGKIIFDQKLLSRRDGIEISQCPRPEIARGFGFSPQEPIWARRYQLTLPGSASGLLFEAISPAIALFKEPGGTATAGGTTVSFRLPAAPDHSSSVSLKTKDRHGTSGKTR